MIEARFQEPIGDGCDVVGPSATCRIEGRTFRCGRHADEVAHYDGGAWRRNQRMYIVIAIGPTVMVHFEDEGRAASPKYGPFGDLRMVDGAVRVDQHPSPILTIFDHERQLWYSFRDRSFWKNIVFTAPASDPNLSVPASEPSRPKP